MPRQANDRSADNDDKTTTSGSGSSGSVDPADTLNPDDANAYMQQLFDKFAGLLTAVGQRTIGFLEGMGEQERVQLAQIYTRRLPGMATGLYDLLAPEFRAGSSEDQNRAIQYLKATGVEAMIDETRGLLDNQALNTNSLLSGIPGVLEVIKKTLRFLPDIPFLGAVLDGVDTLLKLIDNIFEALGSNVSDDAADNYAAAFDRYVRYTRPGAPGDYQGGSSADAGIARRRA